MGLPATLALTTLLAVFALMTAGWLYSLIRKNVTVVDSLWGLGFVLVAWLGWAEAGGWEVRRLAVALLCTLWGVRLSLYLAWRNRGRPEDPRYAAWRRESGGRFAWVSLFKVFWLQAAFLWVIALVLLVPQAAPEPARLTFGDAAGAALALFGMLYEAIADAQLARFKADPQHRGLVMDRGLWRYSRHPNYFGECLVWWGFYGIALAVPGGAFTIFSPILVTLVLLKMTGIPLTERSILERRPAYRDYRRRTSALFPLPPRRPDDEPPD